MRIMFVLSRVPWPLEKGDKLRAFHFIRELSKQHEIVLFCLTDQAINPVAQQKLKEYCSEVFTYRLSRWEIASSMLQALFSPLPFQVHYFKSTKAQKAFDRFLENNIPQHIFCQLLRTAEYVKKYSVIPKSMDYMDALSSGMKKMSKRAQWPFSMVMKWEQKRLETYELSIEPHFENRFIISEQDRDQLSLLKGLKVVGNGIDPSFLEDHTMPPKKIDLLFTGNMAYRPNVESAKFLAKEIMPLVWKTHPNTTLCIAGATPAPAVKALENSKISVTGWVEDISLIYRESKIFVAPMLINSGLQNKLLEAMASGIPSITTTLANNALQAHAGEAIIISDTAQTFSASICGLLDNEAKCEEIGTEGKRYVKGQFSWTKAASLIESAILEEPA